MTIAAIWIICCVRIYKQDFVAGIIQARDRATKRDAVIDALAAVLAVSIAKEAMTHLFLGRHPQYALLDGVFRLLLQAMAVAFSLRSCIRPVQFFPTISPVGPSPSSLTRSVA
ncbi:hypothetical protein OAN307_c16590 [Octadecabacter antarcticus 307]|uniref:Uncharacterized protein n=1 Tax=Octadecabacter antarcticus 307 TaxID=391626 RepID=M9R6D5_9RHOB|nr:hypothetical protein OAN307_c16590 [Octadecabacter antarcticus 307]